MHGLVSFSAAVFSDSLMTEDLGIVLHSSHEPSSDWGSANPSRTAYWDTDRYLLFFQYEISSFSWRVSSTYLHWDEKNKDSVRFHSSSTDISKDSLKVHGENVLFLCGLTVKFSGIEDSKLSMGRWHFLFNCPYALCSYVYLAVLLSCSTGSKGHVNHVINSVPLGTLQCAWAPWTLELRIMRKKSVCLGVRF